MLGDNAVHIKQDTDGALRLYDAHEIELYNLPTVFNYGASIELQNIVVTDGVTKTFTLDPTDPTVDYLFANGVTLSVAKTGLIVGASGHWLISSTIYLQSHATIWLRAETYSSFGNTSSHIVLPPDSVLGLDHVQTAQMVEVVELTEGQTVQWLAMVAGADVTILEGHLRLQFLGPS